MLVLRQLIPPSRAHSGSELEPAEPTAGVCVCLLKELPHCIEESLLLRKGRRH